MTSKETVMQALVSSLKAFFDGGAATNQIAADNIRRFKLNMIEDEVSLTPGISVVDAGEAVPEVSDGVNVRYLLEVRLTIVVKTENPEDTLEAVSNAIADVQKFCDTNQVGGNCLDVQFRSASHIAASMTEQMDYISDDIVTLHLRYLRAVGGV